MRLAHFEIAVLESHHKAFGKILTEPDTEIRHIRANIQYGERALELFAEILDEFVSVRALAGSLGDQFSLQPLILIGLNGLSLLECHKSPRCVYLNITEGGNSLQAACHKTRRLTTPSLCFTLSRMK